MIKRSEHLLKNRRINGVEIAMRKGNQPNHEQRLTGGMVSLGKSQAKVAEVREAVSTMTRKTKGTYKEIKGYALKFNVKSEVMTDKKHGQFYETISPGALNKTDMFDVVCLYDHKPDIVLGSTLDKTLKLKVDKTGLYFECSISDDANADELHGLVTNGNIDKCSFSFHVADGGDVWTFDEQAGMYHREVTNIAKLNDVSIVSTPAYKDTEVKATNLTEEQYRLWLELELMEDVSVRKKRI